MRHCALLVSAALSPAVLAVHVSAQTTCSVLDLNTQPAPRDSYARPWDAGNQAYYLTTRTSGIWQTPATRDAQGVGIATKIPIPSDDPKVLGQINATVFVSERSDRLMAWDHNIPKLELLANDAGPEGAVVAKKDRLVFARGRFPRNTLWSTYGTPSGTVQISTVQNPAWLEPLPGGNVVLFAGTDAQGDRELWTTDGVSAKRVKDLSSASSSHPRYLHSEGGLVFFTAQQLIPGSGYQFGLYASDGTSSGTRRITYVTSGAEPFGQILYGDGGIAFFGSDYYFAAGYQITRWDPTKSSPPALASNLWPGRTMAQTGNCYSIGNTMVFLGREVGGSTARLYAYDSTKNSIRSLMDWPRSLTPRTARRENETARP